jgi:O-antigen/teichoic acid export membrane protein
MASIQGNLYAAAPIPIASIVVGSGVAGLASADRAFRFATLSITALSQALQAWVLDPHGDSVRRRSWIALGLHAILGCGGGLLLLAGLPAATRVLFGQEVAATHEVAVGYAVAFLALNISTPLNSNLFIPFGRVLTVLWVTMLCLAIGIPLMFVLGRFHGASGVSSAFALSEVTMATLAAIASIRAWTELPC